MSIGIKLQELRKQHQMTQENLAEQLDVTRQVISKWERDQSVPSTEIIIELSKIFGVSTDYILGVEQNDASDKNLQMMQDAFEEEIINEPVEAVPKGKWIKWIAFALAVITFVGSFSGIQAYGSAGSATTIGLMAGILLIVIACLAIVLKCISRRRRKRNLNFGDHVIFYFTYVLCISAIIWAIFLIVGSIDEVYAYPAWSRWISVVVIIFVSISTLIGYVGVNLVRCFIEKRRG